MARGLEEEKGGSCLIDEIPLFSICLEPGSRGISVDASSAIKKGFFVVKKVVTLVVIVLLLYDVSATAQVQCEGFEGLACYADTTYGWQFGLTGGEVSVAVPLKIFSTCGPCPSREQVVELGDKMASSIGRQLVFQQIYFAWKDEVDRIEQLKKERKAKGLPCKEKPIEYRYLGCYLKLPPESEGCQVALTRNLQVKMTVRNREGILEELEAKAILAADDERRQNYCWVSSRDNTITADPNRLHSVTSKKSGRTSIILLVMVEDRFKRVDDIKKVKLTGLQVVKKEADPPLGRGSKVTEDWR